MGLWDLGFTGTLRFISEGKGGIYMRGEKSGTNKILWNAKVDKVNDHILLGKSYGSVYKSSELGYA